MTIRRGRPRKPENTLKEIWRRLTNGEEDEQICEELGIDEDAFDLLKVQVFTAKAKEFKALPAENVYVQYVLDQKRTLALLEETIRDLREAADPKSGPARVAAIRARSEILNCLIEKGQTLGVIAKEAEKTKVIGGFAIENLDNKEIVRLLVDEFTSIERIVKDSPVPIEQAKLPTLHYGEKGDENASITISDDDD